MSSLAKRLSALAQLNRAAQQYNTSLWHQIARAKRLHDRSLFSLEDALFWGLTDPSIADDEIDCFMSREARTRLQARVNDPSAGPDVDDKARFYRLCEAAGLPIPKTLGILHTTGTRAEHAPDSGTPHIGIDRLPDGSFVAKPAWGMKGKGILFFEKRGADFLVDGKTLDVHGFTAVAEEYAATDFLIVQHRLRAHPDLAAISRSEAVQSVRIVTYLDDEARPHILFARFKFIRRGNNVDNFSDGQTGNLIADVNLTTGRITRTLKKVAGEFGLKPVREHPDSGKSLFITLPFWQETVGIAATGAARFGALRALAWDIALTPDGPVILEANQDWEIFPIAPYRKPDPPDNWEALIH